MSLHGDNKEEGRITCFSCTQAITVAKYAVCDSCNRSSHYTCAGITTTEQRVLELKGTRKLKYFCEVCERGLSILPDIQSSLFLLKAEIASLKQEIKSSQQTTEPRHAGDQQPLPMSFELMIEEYTERIRRKSNLIIYNMPESREEDAAKRQADDSKRVEDILPTFNVTSSITKTFRLGKRSSVADSKPRPLKIIFENSKAPLNILKRKHLYNGVERFSADKTAQERDHLKFLKSEVDRLNEADPSHRKTIKYVHGCPKIIDTPQTTKNLSNQPHFGSTIRT